MVRSSWMVSFADMLSILLCFLVLAYGLEAATGPQQETALASLRQVFRPGAAAVTAAPALEPETRGGTYWSTWLKARASDVPAIAQGKITDHGATASLSLEGAALDDADVVALADLLRRSGAFVAVRAGASSAAAVSWAEAGERAQHLADRLVAAGLEPSRVVVSGAGAALAVEIGGGA